MDITTNDGNESQTTTTNKGKKQTMMQQQSKRFQKTAAPFIFFTAVPYMIRVIAYGNLNAFAYVCFKDDVHRHIRLHDLFDHDNNLVALAEHSAKSPAGNTLQQYEYCSGIGIILLHLI
jgi:hypothetical protein